MPGDDQMFQNDVSGAPIVFQLTLNPVTGLMVSPVPGALTAFLLTTKENKIFFLVSGHPTIHFAGANKIEDKVNNNYRESH